MGRTISTEEKQQVKAKEIFFQKREAKKTSVKPKPKGRPKGSKNKPYQEPKSQSFQMVKKALKVLLPLLNKHLPQLNAPYLVGDGAYGNQHYQKLSHSFELKLITKLKHNAHLIYPYLGKQKSQGKKRHLGKKVDYNKIPEKYLVKLPEDHPFDEKNIQVFQFKAYAHRIKGALLNIVVIQKYNPTTKKTTQTVLMSTDTKLGAIDLIRYYSLRFQIEFDFRDAKQHFGLSSFKNYKKNQLTNAVNIAFTMCLISRILLKKYKEMLNIEKMGVLDLKALLRVQKYVQILLNTPQNDPEQFLKQENILDIVKMEAINL